MPQALFESIRLENRRWNVREIFRSTNVCVIVYNMLISMVESRTIVAEEDINIINEKLIEKEKMEQARGVEDDKEEDVQSKRSNKNWRASESTAWLL